MELKDFRNVPVVWVPDENSGRESRKFKKIIEEKYKVKLENYWDLHRWSIENISDFWKELWHFSGIIYSKLFEQVIDVRAKMSTSPEWFKGSKLNYAENLLRYRDDHTAIISAGEAKETMRISYSQLYEESCVYAAALKKIGVQKGDRIACYMSNREEPVFAMLGTASIGAIWSGALHLLGAKAVLSRLKLIEPKVLFTMDVFQDNGKEHEMFSKVEEIVRDLPSLEKVVIILSKEGTEKKDISKIRNSCFLEDFLALGRNSDNTVDPITFEQLPFSHPSFIKFTSGTSGTPKALINSLGSSLLFVFRSFWLQNDWTRERRILTIASAGWGLWNSVVTTLFMGVTVVLYEGVPFFQSPTYFWDMVDAIQITDVFIITYFLDELEKKGYVPSTKNNLSTMAVIWSGASVVKPQNYEFVYTKVKKNVIFANSYGSTEIGTGGSIDSTLPIHEGEISAPSLGVDMQCYDANGKSVLGEVGELVICSSLPSLPIGLWGDKDGSLYNGYFRKFGHEDVFVPGDLCCINPVTRGIVIHGRSDDTMNPRGERCVSSEIYNVVYTFPEVRDSLCVSKYCKDKLERVVLFLKMQNGQLFTEQLVLRIRRAIERELFAEVVPEVILQANDIPYNVNGKKMEKIVKKIINGLPYDSETLLNPECLKYFHNVPELQGF